MLGWHTIVHGPRRQEAISPKHKKRRLSVFFLLRLPVIPSTFPCRRRQRRRRWTLPRCPSPTLSSSCRERHRMMTASAAYCPPWAPSSAAAGPGCSPSPTCRARAPSAAGSFPWLGVLPSWTILPAPRSSRYDEPTPCEDQCLNQILSLPLSLLPSPNCVFRSCSGKCNAASR
jgi:hypothetical protein